MNGFFFFLIISLLFNNKFVFEVGFHSVAQAHLEFMTSFQPQPTKY